MNKQVKCHNEVIIVGRITKAPLRCKVNNHKAVQLCLSIPNDNNYNANPNHAYIYIFSDEYELFKKNVGRAIAINGHIECNYGQRIIVDVLSFIKEFKKN